MRGKDPLYTVWLGRQKIVTFPLPLTKFAGSDSLGEYWWVSRCFGPFGEFKSVLVGLVRFYVFWLVFGGFGRFLGILVGVR